MTNTLQTLINRIQDDIDRTDLTAQVTKFINQGIRFYEKENFWFTEDIATESTIANTETYAITGIATNIKDIIRVEITVNNDTYDLIKRDINYIRNKNTPTNTTGRPTDYCLFDGDMYLSPIPDNVYVLKFYYRKDYPDLVNSTDTNDYLDYAEDLIEMYAEGRLYRRVILDRERAADCDTEELRHLEQLRSLHSSKRATNTNKPTQF
jgi:hypothetical protein